MPELQILKTLPSPGYELIDSGAGEKLERYGEVIFRRPDPQALWPKRLPEKTWGEAQAVFSREGRRSDWEFKPGVPERWPIELGFLRFWIRPTAFKHTGLFPEQLPNWHWTQEIIKKSGRPITVLNLFGYTGGATLAAAAAGAEVCHVDGSKVAIGWARDNAALSGLADRPIRWILDDARSFVRRELKCGRRYDGIILDPPAFGHGPSKELWKIEDHLPPLMRMCREIMSETPLFFLINGYASGYSAIAYENNLRPLLDSNGGIFARGELTIEESGSGRLLPGGIFARWHSGL